MDETDESGIYADEPFAKDRAERLIFVGSLLVATVGTAAFAIWMDWL